MRTGFIRCGRWEAALSGAAWLALAVSSAHGQAPVFGNPHPSWCPPAPYVAPVAPPAAVTTPAAPATSPTAPSTPTPEAQAPQQQIEPTVSPERSAAVGGESVAVANFNGGYIDPAYIGTWARLRYDAAYENNRPDRAEFFYPKCGCFRTAPPPLTDPTAPGPPLPERNVDYQDITTHLEVAANNRLSAFIEVPFRFLNPEVNANTAGLSDIDVGVKLGLISECDQLLTFQFRTYTPTGDADRGLGTHHVSLEPALLFWRQLSDRVFLEGEFRDWIPVDGTDFAGNVLRYGAGVSYVAYRSCDLSVAPVMEWVGWTVLNGRASDGVTGGVYAAGGDTIINGKFGVRTHLNDTNSIYVGYGRAVTGEVWYKEIWRLEYRLGF